MARDPVEILRERNAKVEEIRGYVDLTPEAKERRIAEVSEKARAEYQETLEANERERTERLEKSRKAVFAIGYPFGATDGEKAQIRAAYRQAYSDIEYALAPSLGTDPTYTKETLEKFLERAERTGDEELATAAFHTAIDLGIQSVVDSYLEKRPAESRSWQRYTEAVQEAQSAQGAAGLLERALAERALNASPEPPGFSGNLTVPRRP